MTKAERKKLFIGAAATLFTIVLPLVAPPVREAVATFVANNPEWVTVITPLITFIAYVFKSPIQK